MGTVRTVQGDISPKELGQVDYHEHFFHVSPLLPGDNLDDELASTAEASDAHSHGIDTVVDATPIGLGRSPRALARLASASGLRVVATTGVHRPEHYGPSHWIHEVSENALTQWYVRDLVIGCAEVDSPAAAAGRTRPSDVRAGLIKIGLGYWSIPPLARRALAAASAARAATGAPLMIHLEHCSVGHEVLDLLEGEGVPPNAVALAHVDRVPDPGLHSSLAERGAYLGYDGCARYAAAPESALLACLAAVVESGHAEHVLLGGDVARASRYVAYGGMPGLRYLTERYVPRVRERVGVHVDLMLRDNPARWLTWQATSEALER